MPSKSRSKSTNKKRAAKPEGAAGHADSASARIGAQLSSMAERLKSAEKGDNQKLSEDLLGLAEQADSAMDSVIDAQCHCDGTPSTAFVDALVLLKNIRQKLKHSARKLADAHGGAV